MLLIFTGMVWNLTFSFYHTLLALPRELVEAARLLRLSPWQRFTTLELPAATIGLVWNSMMSWAGGWFFLMACESFTLINCAFTLPGLGSYLAHAASRGRLDSLLWGLAALLGLIAALDQVLWRPLVAWSQKFKVELQEDPFPPRSWLLELLRRSVLLRSLRQGFWPRLSFFLDRLLSRPAVRTPRLGRLLALLTVPWALGAFLWGVGKLAFLLLQVPADRWAAIGLGLTATASRVAAALAVSVAWATPVGVAVGLRPALARSVQPVAQMAASVPATALFPVILLLLLRVGGGLDVASVLLMLLGSQWYVLFNVIAGAASLPRDLLEAARSLRVDGVLLWRTLIVPGIFPHLLTGALTAQGGAWNASVVSESLTFAGRTLSTVGLGALIASAAESSDYPLLAASTVVMATSVLLLNRLVWRRLARMAEERYHL